jgi:hypothetical protein
MSHKLTGEFIILQKDGTERVIPNQFTTIGMQQVLKAAFWEIPATWYMGLCAHNPADAIPLANINEPTVGVNGYARAVLPLNAINWPAIGTVNGESYVETRDVTFVVTADEMYDIQINRLFLMDGANVVAISAAMEDGLQFLTENLVTKYRLYFR